MKIHFQIIRNATSNIVRNQHVIIKEESNSCNSWLLIGKRRAVSPKVRLVGEHRDVGLTVARLVSWC